MSISDFFKKKTKEYPSGAKKNTLKGHLFRARIFAAAAVLAGASLNVSAQSGSEKSQDLKKQVLAEAFERHSISAKGDTLLTYKVLGGKEDAERIGKMVGSLMKTQTGSGVLKDLEKYGCVIAILPGMGNNLGVYAPDINAVLLNGLAPDSVLVSTFVHEGAHARQVCSTGYNLDFKLDLASLFTLGRAMEADATKTQVLASYELAQQGDSSAWNGTKLTCAYPVRAFEKSLKEKPKDRLYAERAAFLGYYDDRDYVQQYEVLYSSGFIRACRDTPSEKLNELGSVSLSVDSIAAKICVSGGRQYLSDASALKDSTTYYIHDYIKKTLDSTLDFLDERRKRENPAEQTQTAKRDSSYHNFYILKFTGGFEMPPAQAKKQKEAAVSKNTEPGKESVPVSGGVVRQVAFQYGKNR